jgi:hypothetical protein
MKYNRMVEFTCKNCKKKFNKKELYTKHIFMNDMKNAEDVINTTNTQNNTDGYTEI